MFARLLLLFIAIPLVEIFLFLLVGRQIGVLPTFAVILLTGVFGAALARSQGLRTLAKYRDATAQGRLPAEAVIDSLLILMAGALLIIPGFLSDAVGFLLLVPPVRNRVRTRFEDSLRKRLRVVGVPEAAPFASRGKRAGAAGGDGVINVEAEVVESHAYRDVSGET